MKPIPFTRAAALAAALAAAAPARADVVTEWNARAAEIATAAKMPPPPTYRAMAIVQVAVHRALTSLQRPSGGEAPAPAAQAAAVAAATRGALLALVPGQQEAVEAAFAAALKALPESPVRAAGLAAGERAASEVLAERAGDGAAAPEAYRPETAPGRYVPTAIPVVPRWGERRPWNLASGNQLRPPPPPDLGSAAWARDLEELKAMGGKASARRTAEQTTVAQFWAATTPAIYFPLARAVADRPGRTAPENARLLATLATAMDDALIAVFDAKYAYAFWRPVTAIRNADRDGNEATGRDPSWAPLLETPMHPEYPCAHCILAGAVGAVLRGAAGSDALRLSTVSPTAPGVTRSWDRIEDMVDEVRMARICGGMHYRHSTEVGAAMGRKVGEIAAGAERRLAEAR